MDSSSSDTRPHQRIFRAMNTDIELMCYGPGADRRLARAERWLHAYEERFSRFRILSELSRLNTGAGRPFRASPQLFEMVEYTLDLARRSGGLFDPTVLRSLLDAGYDRSFELIAPSLTRPRFETGKRSSWRDVKLEPESRTIALPPDTGVDLGGIGKGWAADRMASILGRPCLVNAGGDVFLGEHPVDEAAWRVGIADPFHPDVDMAVLSVTERGVATSSSIKRSWRAGDLQLHHLIDPRTGRPSDSNAAQVTVIAASATLADYHAKVALLLGSASGLEYLNREPDLEGLIVRHDDSRLHTAGLNNYLL
ncbi:MAG TPA: FAD:protein FMN transferase [Dehalococcoidia bacterium]|nr:FAD:protein FMN transferase [Dehalococcoidia bacterium]